MGLWGCGAVGLWSCGATRRWGWRAIRIACSIYRDASVRAGDSSGGCQSWLSPALLTSQRGRQRARSPEIGGVSSGRRAGRRGVSRDSGDAQIGTSRTDESDAAGCRFRTHEYCRGLWSPDRSRVQPVLTHRLRFGQGGGVPRGPVRAFGVPLAGLRGMHERASRKNSSRPSRIHPTQKIIRPIAP